MSTNVRITNEFTISIDYFRWIRFNDTLYMFNIDLVLALEQLYIFKNTSIILLTYLIT